MLNHLSIKHFTIVEHLDLDLAGGLSTITGETGAGKSILLDALDLATGGKAEAAQVRPGCDKAEIYACFDVRRPVLLQELEEQGIDTDNGQLILSRIIAQDGRSRGYINGRPVPVTMLRHIGEQLVDIHGQHAQQHLLGKHAARDMLDAYGDYNPLLEQVRSSYQHWQSVSALLENKRRASDEHIARLQLLEYQVGELDKLDLQDGEVIGLEAEQKRLASAEHTLLNAQHAASMLTNDDSDGDAKRLIQHALHKLSPLVHINPQLSNSLELLGQALILVEEAGHDLQTYIESFEINPQRLQQVETRLGAIYDLARKHRLDVDSLYQHYVALSDELSQLKGGGNSLEELELAAQQAEFNYQQVAEKLSATRLKTAKKLSRALQEQLALLALERAQTCFDVQPQAARLGNASGIDQVELLISLNPGQPLQPIAKVASGGELSRISLALQVLCSKGPDTMIFDEVDVGVGGATAERLGRMLKTIGQQKQVICVTHQPQVAALAHQHLRVSKISGKDKTHTRIHTLNQEERSHELARMLGGLEVDQHTLAHASTLLQSGQRA
jgi:DNA repair protein RecN (Recombination protein N)